MWYKSHNDITTQKLSSNGSSMDTSKLNDSIKSSRSTVNKKSKDQALSKRPSAKHSSEPDPEELKDSARSHSKQLSVLNEELGSSPVSSRDLRGPELLKISNQASRSTIEEAPVSEEASFVVDRGEGHSAVSRGTSAELKVSINPPPIQPPGPTPPFESLLLTPSISQKINELEHLSKLS